VKSVGRWVIAGAITLGAFCLVAWFCGAIVMVAILRDPTVRWGVAAAAGTAVAALVALWGQAWATTQEQKPLEFGEDASGASVGGANHNNITGGTFYGPVVQAREIRGMGSAGKPNDEG
jgi:hypothetical protein